MLILHIFVSLAIIDILMMGLLFFPKNLFTSDKIVPNYDAFYFLLGFLNIFVVTIIPLIYFFGSKIEYLYLDGLIHERNLSKNTEITFKVTGNSSFHQIGNRVVITIDKNSFFKKKNRLI